MKQTLLIATIGFLIATCSFAQPSFEKRIEIDLANGYAQDEIHVFEDKGVLLSELKVRYSNNQKYIRFKHYDKNLNFDQQKEVGYNINLSLDTRYNGESHSFFLFKNRRGKYEILAVEAATLTIKKVNGVLLKKCKVKDMLESNGFVYLNTVVNKQPIIFVINWQTGEKAILPINLEGFTKSEIEINDIQKLENTDEVAIYVRAKTNLSKRDMYMLKVGSSGKVNSTLNLTNNLEHNFTDVSSLYIKNNEYICTGTYGDAKKTVSQGIYLGKITANQLEFVKFYNFLDLDNFLSYLPEKKQEKIEKKKSKKEAKGKEYSLSYNIEPHEILVKDDGYILIGEAYYPTYRVETYTTTSFVNGVAHTVTHTHTVFDGYKYTHAFIAKFGLGGDLIWDQTFELTPTYKPFVVKKFISLVENENKLLKMTFVSRGKIVSMVVNEEGEILSDEKTASIETLFEGDKVKWSRTNIDYWYDNKFICYGSQKIKNQNKSGQKRRKVYFISKVKF